MRDRPSAGFQTRTNDGAQEWKDLVESVAVRVDGLQGRDGEAPLVRGKVAEVRLQGRGVDDVPRRGIEEREAVDPLRFLVVSLPLENRRDLLGAVPAEAAHGGAARGVEVGPPPEDFSRAVEAARAEGPVGADRGERGPRGEPPSGGSEKGESDDGGAGEEGSPPAGQDRPEPDRSAPQDAEGLLGAREAILRLSFEEAADGLREPARRLRPELPNVGRLRAEPREDRAERRFGSPREASGEELEEEDAEGIEVRPRVDVVAQGLLRGHVVGRAEGGVGLRETRLVALEAPGEAEIDDPGPAVGAEEDVAGLDVAVDDPGRVEGGEPFQDLDPDPDDVADRKRSARPLPEGSARDELHRQERTTLVLADVVDADEARARDRVRDLHLAPQAGEGGGRESVGPQELEGDGAFQLAVPRLEDEAGAPLAEEAAQLPPPREDVPGRGRRERPKRLPLEARGVGISGIHAFESAPSAMSVVYVPGTFTRNSYSPSFRFVIDSRAGVQRHSLFRSSRSGSASTALEAIPTTSAPPGTGFRERITARTGAGRGAGWVGETAAAASGGAGVGVGLGRRARTRTSFVSPSPTRTVTTFGSKPGFSTRRT